MAGITSEGRAGQRGTEFCGRLRMAWDSITLMGRAKYPQSCICNLFPPFRNLPLLCFYLISSLFSRSGCAHVRVVVLVSLYVVAFPFRETRPLRISTVDLPTQPHSASITQLARFEAWNNPATMGREEHRTRSDKRKKRTKTSSRRVACIRGIKSIVMSLPQSFRVHGHEHTVQPHVLCVSAPSLKKKCPRPFKPADLKPSKTLCWDSVETNANPQIV